MKKIAIIFLLIFFQTKVCAIEYETLDIMSPPYERFGISNTPESSIKKSKTEEEKNEVVVKSIDNTKELISNKDLNIKYLSSEIASSIDMEQTKLLSDLVILYNGAIRRSETIRYAIYKLSNPDEDKPDESTIKKMLKPIASFSSIAGTALSDNPYMAASSIIGGSLIGAITSDDKQINYKFTKVNDADMVILVRKIDELQKKLLFLYMDYVTNKELYNMALDNLEKRKIMYQVVEKDGSREEIIIADKFYRDAQEYAIKAKTKYDLSRNILENLAGKEALEEIEKNN